MIEFIAGILAGIALTKKVRSLREFEIPKWLRIPPRTRIVKFGEGEYAVRVGRFAGHEYVGIRDGHKWSKTKYVREYCITDLETCKKIMQYEKGTPIDLEDQ